MSQCFRIRFVLSGPTNINSPQRQLVLAERGTDGEDVVLRGLGEAVIQDSAQLVVEGRDYRTEDEAREAGDRWRGMLEKAFAAVNLGADFGDRAPISVLTDTGAQMLEEQLGQPVLNDVHGVMTYECEPRPRFASTSVTIGVGRSAEHLLQAITRARESGASTSPAERLAYDLFSASFVLPAADARFVMLMMAVETLVEPGPRSDGVRAHVERLIALTRDTDLPEAERDSVIGSLSWLMNESISQAGRRLANTLGDRTYMEQTPTQFFTSCYDLRSRLVHGHYPRPHVQEVDATRGALEVFVGDLLAGEVKEG